MRKLTLVLALLTSFGALGVGASPGLALEMPSNVGLVDTTTGIWHLRAESGFSTSFYFGNPGDAPFAGDWNCSGIDTPGLYRVTDGFVYLRNSNTQGIADIEFFFGNPGDVPLAGDFNGDGCDTVSLYRPSTQEFFIINELGSKNTGLGAADFSFVFGDTGDTPITADFDGDGSDEVALHRPRTGQIYYRDTLTTGNADNSFVIGNPGDHIIGGDWDGDSIDTPGIFRSSSATFFLRNKNTAGAADLEFSFGIPSSHPISGHWGLAESSSDLTWSTNEIAAGVSAADMTIGIDGNPIIISGIRTLATFPYSDLTITHCADPECSASTTTQTGTLTTDDLSVVIGIDGLPLFTYFEPNQTRLYLARCSTIDCGTFDQTLISERTPKLHDLALRADGSPVIAYFDVNRNVHHVVSCTDRACAAFVDEWMEGGSGFNEHVVAVGEANDVFVGFYKPASNTSLAPALTHCPDSCFDRPSTLFPEVPGIFEGGAIDLAIGDDGIPTMIVNQGFSKEDSPLALNAYVIACQDVQCAEHTQSKITEDGNGSSVEIELMSNGDPIIMFGGANGLTLIACLNSECTLWDQITVSGTRTTTIPKAFHTSVFGNPVALHLDQQVLAVSTAHLGG